MHQNNTKNKNGGIEDPKIYYRSVSSRSPKKEVIRNRCEIEDIVKWARKWKKNVTTKWIELERES